MYSIITVSTEKAPLRSERGCSSRCRRMWQQACASRRACTVRQELSHCMRDGANEGFRSVWGGYAASCPSRKTCRYLRADVRKASPEKAVRRFCGAGGSQKNVREESVCPGSPGKRKACIRKEVPMFIAGWQRAGWKLGMVRSREFLGWMKTSAKSMPEF